MSDKYILNENGDAVPCDSLRAWGQWFESADRVLAKDESHGVRVSTVFLGLDHSFGDEVPILWETMIFGGPLDQYQERHSSKSAALEGHERAKALALRKSG